LRNSFLSRNVGIGALVVLAILSGDEGATGSLSQRNPVITRLVRHVPVKLDILLNEDENTRLLRFSVELFAWLDEMAETKEIWSSRGRDRVMMKLLIKPFSYFLQHCNGLSKCW
jgi:hypothetical protein